ncbi:AMP-binding protein [Streptomyces platensis]|uniref:AMP-binding protein n=1 Tax=Streptomyces platensis TaxID=58346 RepID=UPI0036AE9175
MRDNLVDVLVRHAVETPDRTAAVFIHEGEGRQRYERSVTYAELDRAARSLAVWLRERCASGERALLLYPAGLEFVKGLLGCLYAGVVPVPAPMPNARRPHLKGATGIALDADPCMVLTESGHLASVADWAGQQGLNRMLCIATDTVGGRHDQWCRPVISREPFALLRYSWGSDAEPQGVMIGHDNLVHALESHRRTLGLTPESRLVTWLPVQRGTWLVGTLLTSLFLGSTAVLISTESFMHHPYLWLDAISRWRAEVSMAPHFAYDLCAEEVTPEQAATLDLSGWRHACTLVTPTAADTLERFGERFAASGFQPSAWRVFYRSPGTSGAAVVSTPGKELPITKADRRALETNVLAKGTGTDSPQLIGLGTASGTDVRIVDPHGLRVMPDGHIGEVWLRGRGLGRGYWNKQDSTVRTFRAVTADGEGGFLRTGDLGAIQDGELYISGRLEDVLVLQGRHLYPQHLEEFIEHLDNGFSGLTGRVFAVPVPGREAVVVQEWEPAASPSESPSELAVTIRDAVAGSHGIALGGLVLVPPGGLPRADNRSASRALTRELFVNDALEALYEDLRPELLHRYRPAGAPVPR